MKNTIRRKDFDEEYFRPLINDVDKVKIMRTSKQLIHSMLRRKLRKYINVITPIGLTFYQKFNILYEMIDSGKMSLATFIHVFSGYAINLIFILMTKYGIRDIMMLARINRRITEMMSKIVSDEVNLEPIYNTNDIMTMIRICNKYRLTMIDFYKVLSLLKRKHCKIFSEFIVTPEQFQEYVVMYKQKKENEE